MKDTIVGAVKSKTQWAALAVVILGVLQDQAQLLTTIVGEQRIGLVMAVIGILFMVLRAVTGWSLAEKAQGLDKQGGFARVPLLVALAAVSLAIGASGCAVLQPAKAEIPVAEELPAPAKEAQRVLNEARLVLAAMADDITSKVERRVITPEQGAAKIATVKRHRDDVVRWQGDLDRAVAAMSLGDIRKVENQAKALELVLERLEKEIAELERKGG